MKCRRLQSSTATLLSCILLCGVWCGQTGFAQQNDNSQVTTGSPEVSQAMRSAKADDSFIIGSEDVLAISVWKEPDLTKQIPVRTDGKISLPLVGDIQAAGRTPLQLQMDISDKLKGFITDPQVTVIVQQINSIKYNIFGEVVKPGSFVLTGGLTIIDAIAAAGGLRDFAKKKGIYILRINSAGVETRYPFNYDDFIKGKNTKQNILLKPRDTVVVP